MTKQSIGMPIFLNRIFSFFNLLNSFHLTTCSKIHNTFGCNLINLWVDHYIINIGVEIMNKCIRREVRRQFNLGKDKYE